MTVRERLLRHAVAAIVRIYRSGGTGRIALPDADPGNCIIFEIDQRAAEEIVAWGSDRLIADIRRRKAHGEPLSEKEEISLGLWHEKVPRAYDWCAVPGGPSFLIPQNAAGELIGPLHEVEVVLAAHPSEYSIGWQVPKARRAPGFRGHICLDGSHRWGRRQFIGYLPFPLGTGLLAAWTRFDHLNSESAARRLPPEDRRRYLLPYGAKTLPDGREIVFNRAYQTLYERLGLAGHPDGRWFYFDGHSEDAKRHRAEEALRRCIAGEPLPPDWRAPRRP